MITGIECAGLVLGIFPLVVEGLRFLALSIETLRNARAYASILYQYSLDLGVEQAKFNQTWTRILQLSNLPSGASSANVLHLGSDIPSNFHRIIVASLSNCPEDVKERFKDAIEQLSRRLGEVQKDFRIEQQVPDKRGAKKLMKMLKTELNAAYRNKQLSDIRNRNFDLDLIVNGEYQMQMYQMQVRAEAARSQTQNIRKSASIIQTNFYNAIQRQATTVHGLLQQTLFQGACCGKPHSAGLQLEFRGGAKFSASGGLDVDGFIDQPWRFRFHLNFHDQGYPVQTEYMMNACDLECQVMEGTLANKPYGAPTPHTHNIPLATPMLSPQAPALVADLSTTTPLTAAACDIQSRKESEPTALLQTMLKRFSLGKKGDVVNSQLDLASSKIFTVPTRLINHVESHERISQLRSIQLSGPPISNNINSSADPSMRKSLQPGNTMHGPVPTITVSEPQCTNELITHNCWVPGTISGADLLADGMKSCNTCSLSNNQVFGCLCSAIKSSVKQHIQSTERRTPGPSTCVGVLSKSSYGTMRVCPRRNLNSGIRLRLRGTISLQTLLQQAERGKQKPPIVSRLRLGVILASSIMQLHESNWLTGHWNSSDILFEDLQDLSGCAVIENPFLKKSFQCSNTDAKANDAANPEWANLSIFCHPLLFSLGILLIEIHYWRLMENLKGHLALPSAIKKILGELFDVAGARYDLAVRRCLHGLDTREMSLSDQEFKSEVYAKIVHPLEENLRNWYGVEEVQEVFQDNGV